MSVGALSTLLFGGIAGVCADRYSKKVIMIISNLMCALFTLIIPICAHYELLNIPVLVLFKLLQSSMSVFFGPSHSAMIPAIVEKKNLLKFNSSIGIADSISYLIGPALGGILIALIGWEGLFYINGMSFILSSLFIVNVEIPKIRVNENVKKSPFFKDFKDGVDYILHDKSIQRFLSIGMVSMIAYSPLFIILPVYLDKILNISGGEQAKAIGILYSALSAGSLLGYA